VASPLLITADFPCTECRYNLRGLTLNANCPECGRQVSASYRHALGDDPEACWDVAIEMKRQWVADASSAAGYPPDAGLFLMGAIQMSRTQSHRAHEICKAVREYAVWYFNERNEAMDLLNEWRLQTSEDVGHLFFALAKAGLVPIDANTSITDFAGLFTLATLFSEPTEK
jgi:uncharacterized repeat protein (TIGR04138 family)